MTGLVTVRDADRAFAATARFDPQGLHAASCRGSLPASSLVAKMRAGLQPGPTWAIDTGATSGDGIDTAMVLTILAFPTRFDFRLGRLIAVLD